MGVSSKEKVELSAYQLKYAAQKGVYCLKLRGMTTPCGQDHGQVGAHEVPIENGGNLD